MQRKSTRMSNKRLIDDSKYKGLNNFGNTCYLNVIIQSLKTLSSFTDYCSSETFTNLFATKHNNSIMKIDNSVTFNFHRIFTAMKIEKRNLLPDTLRNILCRKNEVFDNDDQQDAHEVFILLIEIMHNEVSQSVKLSQVSNNEQLFQTCKTFYSESYSPIYDMFHGIMVTTKTCQCCKNIKQTFEPSSYIGLDIPTTPVTNIVDYTKYLNIKCKNSQIKLSDKEIFLMSCQLSEETKQEIQKQELIKNEMTRLISVDDCLKQLQQPEIIEDVNCINCGNISMTKCTYGIAVAPKIMIIQIKRFKFGQSKNCTGIEIQHNITIQTLDDNVQYKLKTLVNHVGINAQFGHYYMLTFDETINNWIKIDDEHVSICDEKIINNAEIYLMIYERVDTHVI